VASIGSLLLRPMSASPVPAAPVAAAPTQSLYRLDWQPSTVDANATADGWQVLGPDPWGVAGVLGVSSATELAAGTAGTLVACFGGPATTVREETGRALELLRSWLPDPRFASARLVVVTSGAVACGSDESPDLAGAAVSGLVRSAQAEHPDRIVLID